MKMAASRGVSQESGRRLLLASLTLTLGNPKAIIFVLAVVPTVVDVTTMTFLMFLEFAAAVCTILTSVLTVYSMTTLRARRLFRSASAVRWLNRSTGANMARAAVAVPMRR